MVTVLKNLLTMSLSGSIVILLVLVLRLVLKKAPARLICLLWLLAGLRLVLPFHIEADFSLQPDTQQLIKPIVSNQEYVPQEYVSQDMVPAMPTVGENITINTDSGVTTQVQRTVDWVAVAAYVWAVGVAVMLVYAAVSYIKLKRQVRQAVVAVDGAWECGSLNGPFLLGYLKPRIFLPVGLAGRDREYVMSHERTHLAWGDHWTKLLGFLCLSIHWFNPLVWLAYRLLCQDIETACDEQVVKGYDVEQRKAYSQALLSCSSGSRPVSACPIAFGEANVKERIMKVLNYRKPGFWICLVCVIAIIGAAVFFLTDPLREMTMEDYVAMLGTEKSEFLTKLGVKEEDVTSSESSQRYTLPDTISYNGREYQVYYSAGGAMRNRISTFDFVSKPDPNEQTSLDAFIQEYLAMQGLFSQQYGQPNPINLYTDAQQIKDNYDNRKITEDDVLSIMTSWEVYDDDIPYSDVRAFLKELLTWEEVEYLEKWYGTGLQGRLHINLIGNCPPDGVASFWISFTASARPVWKDTIKHDTLFEKYASRLGSYNEEFFEGLEVNEDKISFTDYGAVMWEKVEYEGIDWSIGTHSVKEMDDRVTLVAFTASPASFDEMAAGYLRMLEFLKGIYGEPTEVTQEVSNIEQLREVYNKTLNFHPDAAAIWNFDQADDVDPQVWYRMNELVKTDYETETIRRIYGSDAVPKANFHIQLYCDAGEGTSDDNGVISTFYSYELTIIFSIKITPEHS